MEQYQIFISYRRDGGGDLAGRLKDRFVALGYTVFFDHESLDAGVFNTQIYDAISACDDFLLVLPPNALDRCNEERDWVRREVAHALKEGKNIIPIIMDGFSFPEHLPEEIDMVRNMEGVTASAEYFDGVILRIKKMLHSKIEEKKPQNILMKRVDIFLEDQEWEKADEYCERVLDQDPYCAPAYLAKLLVQLKCSFEEALEKQSSDFGENGNFKKALRFADAALRTKLEGYLAVAKEREQKEVLAQKLREEKWLNEELQKVEEVLAKELDEQSKRLSEAKAEEGVHVNERRNAEEYLAKVKNAANLQKSQRLEREIRLEEIKLLEEALAEEKITIERMMLEGRAETDRLVLEICVCEKKVEELKKNETHFSQKTQDEASFEKYIRSEMERLIEFKKNYDIPMTEVEIVCKKLNEGKSLLDGMLAGLNQIYEEKKAREERLKEDKQKEEQKKRLGCRGLIASGALHIVGLKSDGTVVATGSNEWGQCDVKNWKDVIAVSAGDAHTVGLRSDGTVLAIGSNSRGQCNTWNWTDIVAIAAGSHHTVGLKSDGTVLAVGEGANAQCNVSKWRDIVAISAGVSHTVGVKSDGTAVAVGGNGIGQCDVGKWTDLVAISAGNRYTVGLKSNGTVVAIGANDSGQCNVALWNDIVAVSAGSRYTVGLKCDGGLASTVRGLNDRFKTGQEIDMVAIETDGRRTVGLRSDGSVVTTDGNFRDELSKWNLFARD